MTLTSKAKSLALIAGAMAATLVAFGSVAIAKDPTEGRIKRDNQNRAEYHRCASFALRVYQGGLSQAGNNSAKIRAARAHYHANLARCRKLL